jgi:hypothetical protein
VKAGDYVRRTWGEQLKGPEDFGVILELHLHTGKEIATEDVGQVTILQSDGMIRKWRAAHTEVIID